jgi:phage-related protein
MDLDLISTIPVGLVLALAAKQLYTLMVTWLNQPTILVHHVLESFKNNTLTLRNNVGDVTIFLVGGALDIINTAKELLLHIVGGAIQEVLRVLHLIVHIVKQGIITIKNVYSIILVSLETFYLALKSINNFVWYIVEGGSMVVNTVVSAPSRMYEYANTTITVFVEEYFTPAVNWFLYGPKISTTRYYLLLLVLLVGSSLWKYYGIYKKNNYSPKKEKSA